MSKRERERGKEGKKREGGDYREKGVRREINGNFHAVLLTRRGVSLRGAV